MSLTGIQGIDVQGEVITAGDAITVSADGTIRKAKDGDAVLGFALPEGGSNRPSADFAAFQKKAVAEMAKNTAIQKEFYSERLGQPYYREEEYFQRELAGWRPFCLLCRRPVDMIRARRDDMRMCVEVQYQCHGRRETMSCNEREIRRLRGGLRELVELRGPFRGEAEAAERRYREEEEYIRSRSRSVFIANKTPSFFIADEIDDVKFDDSKYRRIMEKMQAQQMQATLATMTTAATSSDLTGFAEAMRYITSGSSTPPPPKKPTKAELLKMLAEYENAERPEIPLDAERVITL